MYKEMKENCWNTKYNDDNKYEFDLIYMYAAAVYSQFWMLKNINKPEKKVK